MEGSDIHCEGGLDGPPRLGLLLPHRRRRDRTRPPRRRRRSLPRRLIQPLQNRKESVVII
ncbi:hypothetical protein QJS10_CPB04g00388 [Acorus calamus]|uniref:Uncharacterized protein n=1 Tax=Acorus calamus TaxID=4465 RepID=A0AAV9F2S0_ACOCL|nr:hypothetical protein QJS10_CPB04g00388 [Acorus calamus]